MTSTMKAMGISHYHQERLEEFTLPIPTITDDEVLVEVYAARVNPVDFKIRDGVLKLLINYQMPLVLGLDFAGKVAKVGASVTKFRVGDEVYGLPQRSMIGTFAEYVAVKAEDISFKPRNLTFEEAASVPLVGLTNLPGIYRTYGTTLRRENIYSSRCRRYWHLRHSVGEGDGHLRCYHSK